MGNFIIEEFKKYKVTLYSNNENSHERYSVHLKLPSGEAVIKFYEGDHPMDNKYKATVNNHNTYELNVKAERFPNFIDILRNEKPLFFYFNKDNYNGYVTTSDEPVGEGESETETE